MDLLQCRKAWRQNMRRHRLGAGHAHDALKLRIASADRPFDPQGFDLDALCLAQDIVARRRQRVAVWGSVEKPYPKIGLQRREPTTPRSIVQPADLSRPSSGCRAGRLPRRSGGHPNQALLVPCIAEYLKTKVSRCHPGGKGYR